MTSVAERPEFAAWVDARRPALWRSAWLLTGEHHRAEDLLQTALLKVWPHWDRLSSSGDPEPYVRRVLYTTYLAWWRRAWNAEVPTAELPDRPGRSQDGDDHGALADALALLPRGQRAVVVARFYDDLSVTQAAHLLEVSEGTVKSQTARALSTLRRSPLLTTDQTGDRS